MVDKAFEILFIEMYGCAAREITDLVIAAESAYDNYGKKSFFGRDKGRESCVVFIESVFLSAKALERGGKVASYKNQRESLDTINHALGLMRKAYPNWPRAYLYWDEYFEKSLSVYK